MPPPAPAWFASPWTGREVPTVSTSTPPDAGYRLALSVDLEEWFHSRRWIDGQQAERVPDTGEVLRRIYGTPAPTGEVLPPTRRLLEIFAAHDCRVTFFVLGEIAQWYPDLIREIAAHGHESPRTA